MFRYLFAENHAKNPSLTGKRKREAYLSTITSLFSRFLMLTYTMIGTKAAMIKSSKTYGLGSTFADCIGAATLFVAIIVSVAKSLKRL